MCLNCVIERVSYLYLNMDRVVETCKWSIQLLWEGEEVKKRLTECFEQVLNVGIDK